jgi:carbonic anhydrase
MKKFIAGIVKFQTEVFPKQRHIYEGLADGQQPDTLYIGCSDSRVVPNDMLQAGPGELFIIRNAGNIVPPFSENAGGVAATVEYAVEVLKVRHIVVCGHSDCGAMRALMHPEKIKDLKAVYQWLHHAERVSTVTRELHSGLEPAQYLDRLIEENVIAQLEHLASYPCVAGKLRRGTLLLHGLVFNIKDGGLRMLDRSTLTFAPVTAATQVPQNPPPLSFVQA